MKKKHIFTLLFGSLFIAIVVLVLVFRNHDPVVVDVQQIQQDSVVEVPQARLYGLEIDTFSVIKKEVKSGESFGKLVGSEGLGTQQIFAIAEKAQPIFDVRKLRAGNRYTILKGQNSAEPAYFIYEESQLHYFVFSLKDSTYVFAGERVKSIQQKHVSGVINSSLSQTLNNGNLTNKLSGIYAWSIDFFRIQKGDSITVVYEEIYVDDTLFAGIGNILSARFVHYGSDYFAFRYTDASGQTDFYDENGRSLRKAFLKAPLEFSRISSRYTMKRFHPVQKRWKAHLGTDYAAPRGTPIMTTADGTIVKAGYTSGNGNYVKVEHNSVYSTQYLHMTNIAKGIKNGVRVRQGQVIGYVGSTGLATGPHVCYRFWKNGKQVDPFGEKLPDANPIKDEYKAAFFESIKEPLQLLTE